MSLLSQARERLRALVSRTREERDLDEELRVHIEMETEANVRRGMRPEEARRQALIAFGGVERFKEDVRDARSFGLVEDLAQDMRYALRRLRREPGYSLPVIATLALGIGATAAIFALVNAVLIRPLPYHEADRLVVIRHEASLVELPTNGVSGGIAAHYRAHNRVFEAIGMYTEDFFTLTNLDEAERVRGAGVTPSVLEVLRPAVFDGRWLAPGHFEPTRFGGRLISHSLWMRRYGADSSIVGRTIEIDHRGAAANGVLEPGFGFPHRDTDVWDAESWPERAKNTTRASLRSLMYSAVARLKPGVSPKDAERDLQRLIASLPDAFPDVTARQLEEMGFRALVVPLKDAMIGDTRVALLLLMGTAAFLLLITWANITNLTLVRAERLRREVAVARALGAGTAHLARRFLSESVVLAVVGGAFGLALATLAIHLRFGFAPDDIPRLRDVSVDAPVLGLTLLVTLLSTALLGGAALLSALRPTVAGVLNAAAGRITAGRREQQLRRVLVAGQVALALTLLIASALMAQSFWRLKQVDLGFDPEGLLTFRLPISPQAYESGNHYHAMAGIHSEVMGQLRALPGVEQVEAASLSAFPLTPVASFNNFRLATTDDAGEPAEGWPYAQLAFATPGYFEAMGIPILRGRTFRWEDTGREGHGIVLSASLATALFGDEDPIGRNVRQDSRSTLMDFVVVGVVGDVPGETIRDGPIKAFYFPHVYPPKADSVTFVVHIFIPQDEVYVVRSGLPTASLIGAIQRTVRRVNPKLVVTRATTLEQLVADDMSRTRLTMLLLLVASATALALGVVGIYGVVSYMVSRRANELGIRIALGQSQAGVLHMVLRQGAVLALAGIAAGLVAAFALTRYLRALLYEVSPSDPLAFTATAALLFLVALGASYVPARRVTQIDPASTLRSE
jgi:putative ABC transport system permease protein